jgi:hypothetical protein
MLRKGNYTEISKRKYCISLPLDVAWEKAVDFSQDTPSNE